uniref:Paired domain-containing protein n=1 Tax=Lepeophtheirus salmonis TaxID=72036 RepID=A0A0K2U5H8_LEPSM
MEAKRNLVLEMLECQKTPTEIANDLKISRTAVYSIKKRFETQGTVARKSGQGRKRTVRTKALVIRVKNYLASNPMMTVRGTAKKMNLSEVTLRRIIKDDLGTKKEEKTYRYDGHKGEEVV